MRSGQNYETIGGPSEKTMKARKAWLRLHPLLRKPLPPSTAKNSLDRSAKLILLFVPSGKHHYIEGVAASVYVPSTPYRTTCNKNRRRICALHWSFDVFWRHVTTTPFSCKRLSDTWGMHVLGQHMVVVGEQFLLWPRQGTHSCRAPTPY